MKYIITGGLGFIGSAIIKKLVKNKNNIVLNIDKVTYAANKNINQYFGKFKNYNFQKIDISNYNKLKKAIFSFEPNVIINCAAETHVDNSIKSPNSFIKTNIFGTYNLLVISEEYHNKVNKNFFKFHHVSTDEVFGEITDLKKKFNEKSPYRPNSPYSASKASSDHLVSAWARTYNLPITMSNSCNNYGPNQHFEKLIPVIIKNAFLQKKIPIYGNGNQIREWIHVDDNADIIIKISKSKTINENFCIGSGYEISNLKLCKIICNMMDKKNKNHKNNIQKYSNLIQFVKDRPGHDFRYALNSSKVKKAFGWKPKINIENGLSKTINYYVRLLSKEKK